MPTEGFGLGDLVTLVRNVISGNEVQVDIVGQVDIGGATPIVSPTTGAGAINASYAPGVAFWLHSITCHFSAAPTTAENFTVTLDANDGAAYDTLLYEADPSVFGDQDLEYVPEYGPRLYEAGDAIDVAYLNTDNNTYGLRIVATLA